MGEIMKTRCISDAQIQFVSLVDKAANKKSFLIAKAEDGKASFSAYGKIVKTDTDSHYVTGIVYEPMTEDSQGDYMTEEEIRKAAHWFAKNGDGIDIQHNFEKFEKAEVVENWIAKADFEIGKEKVKKGTWLMTVEITDPDVWAAVEKGEITGFSMGGTGIYSEDNVDLDSLNKSEGKSFFKKLAKMFGFEVVEKGAFADKYAESKKQSDFYNAFYDLQNILYGYDSTLGKYKYETEPETIKECLKEFSEAIQDVLKSDDLTIKKSLGTQNIKKLKSVYENIGNLLNKAGETEENMTKAQAQEFIEGLVKKAMEKYTAEPEPNKDDFEEQLQKAVNAAVAKAMENNNNDVITKNDVVQMVTDSVAKAVEPLYKARGIVTNLNGEPEPVGKSDDLFDGLFL